MNWPDAQNYCCDELGGKLWEPLNGEELNAVLASDEVVNSCARWIGLNNWNYGSRRFSSYSDCQLAKAASDGSVIPG